VTRYGDAVIVRHRLRVQSTIDQYSLILLDSTESGIASMECRGSDDVMAPDTVA
jgi:hypothetical protein